MEVDLTGDRQERIRNRAHQIWLDEGKPLEQHERHWAQAIADIDGEDAGGPKLDAPGASTEKVAAAAAPKAGRKPRRADK
jgi:hypothetical protein